MESCNEASFGFCRPDDAAPANGAAPVRGLRLSGRNSVAALIQSLPDEFAGSMLALFMGHEFNLLALAKPGHGHAADCALEPARPANRGAKARGDGPRPRSLRS